MSSYSDFARIAGDLELQKGEAYARAQRNRGQLIGNSLASLGQLVPQIIEARRQEALDRQAARERAIDVGQQRTLRDLQIQEAQKRLGGTPDAEDPIVKETKALDLALKKHEAASRILLDTNAQNYAARRPALLSILGPSAAEALPEHYPGDDAIQAHLAAGLSVKEQLEQRKADVQKLTAIPTTQNGVAGTLYDTPQPGQFYPGAPPKEGAAPHVGSFEDYVTRTYGANPTPQQVVRARQVWARADDKPDKPSADDKETASLIDTVIANPALWDDLTPTVKGKIAAGLSAKGYTGFGKPLSNAAVKQIADSQTAIDSLKDLREVLKANEQYIGPLAGLQAAIPWSDARKAQANIDLVRQRVGKALEGGVLRKEDEEKYKKILATLRDTPTTAIYKVDQLIKSVENDVQNFKVQQRLAGRKVNEPESKTPASPGGLPTYQDYLRSRSGR